MWSADRFVFGAAAIANNYGIPPLVIGLTIVAMGSSAPEVMISATAALEGQVDTAVGNAIGSNITNMALVLGAAALLRPLAVSSNLISRELPILLAATALVGYLLNDLLLGLTEAMLLFGVFIVTMAYLVFATLRQSKQQPDPMESEVDAEIPHDVSTAKALLWIAIGGVVLAYSSDVLVESASNIARYFGMSDLLIGLTIIAIGTSLPELAASIAGVLKNEDDMVLGNIIGSNMFNMLFVLSIPGFLAPSEIDPFAAGRDYYVMAGLTAVLFLMAMGFGKQRRINRWEGALLMACFVGYQYLLFTTSFS